MGLKTCRRCGLAKTSGAHTLTYEECDRQMRSTGMQGCLHPDEHNHTFARDWKDWLLGIWEALWR